MFSLFFLILLIQLEASIGWDPPRSCRRPLRGDRLSVRACARNGLVAEEGRGGGDLTRGATG